MLSAPIASSGEAANGPVGWAGTGRMGYAMARRLLEGGTRVVVWNRTRAKAEALATLGARVVDRAAELAGCDTVFCIVSTAADLEAVCFGEHGILSGPQRPGVIVDSSSIGLTESARIRRRLASEGAEFIAAPVSGNANCVMAGKLSAVVSGPRDLCERVRPYLERIAPRGVSYTGEGDLARVCKIAHNLMLGTVIESLCEVTLLAQRAGVPRHAFLEFLNNSVMGSIFTRYKSPALVNLDWTPTFTAQLLRKDLDLGLSLARDLGVSMPVTAGTREVLQAHIDARQSRTDQSGLAQQDFAALLEYLAHASGITLASDNTKVPTGLEIHDAVTQSP